jgi:superfamily II DNA or RNA helicase
MARFDIEKINESIIRLDSDDSGAVMDLSEAFTFFVDGYKFIPSYRNKLWDGKIRLYDARRRTLPYGLLYKSLQFISERGYEVKLDPNLKPENVPSKEELLDFVKSLDIRSKGKTIEPRDYQIDAFIRSITQQRSLVISPTGSGKSLIIYMLIRYFLAHSKNRALIVVPTTSLVEQMKKDFADYSSHDSAFDADTVCHQIYSGKEKHNFEADVVITTWQSAIQCGKGWFTQFGMVIGDEAHLFKAKSLNTIMGNLINARYRIGTTGTLDGSQCNELVLIGNFGPIHKVITTKNLIDNDTLADLNIQCIVLKHDDVLRKAVAKMDYHSEIATIVEHPNRNQFISKLALTQKGNTLVIFNLVKKHGVPLYDMIKEMAPEGKKIFYVSGEINAAERETIREITESEDGAVIVASAGTFSTGINIKNLHNVIFAAPTKSQIRVLQTIGRGLRKSDNGQGTTIYDISDNFSWRKRKNYTMKHAQERIEIYTRENFKYRVYEIDMKL